MYAYPVGLVVGRFQMFHNGHEHMIRSALDICDTVLVFIGSAQEHNTQKNPYSYMRRLYILQKIFEKEIKSRRLIIQPLNDIGVGNTTKWGDYVLKTAREVYGLNPHIMISGKEDRRESWFNDELDELFIPRVYDVSATALRLAMLRDDREFWKKNVPQVIWDEYDDLRRLLIAAQENAETASI